MHTTQKSKVETTHQEARIVKAIERIVSSKTIQEGSRLRLLKFKEESRLRPLAVQSVREQEKKTCGRDTDAQGAHSRAEDGST